MQAQTTNSDLLKTIVAGAVDLLPGINWAGIALIRSKKVTAQHPTDEVARVLAQLQTELGEGPALSSLADHATVIVPDLSAETRWPRFVEAAQREGVNSLMTFRLFVHDRVLGAFTLYGPESNSFTEQSVVIGEILAQHAAVALADAAARDQMLSAIDTRDVIGQAKGILIQRDGITGLQAFAVLTKASQETNVKLVDVARFLVQETENTTLR